MQGEDELKALLMLLSSVYANEGRAAGKAASAALVQAANDAGGFGELAEIPVPDVAITALAIDPHPEAKTIEAGLKFVRWFEPDKSIDNLSQEKGAQMRAAELLGPNGQFYHPSLRVGLYVQLPNFDYTTRRHSAEETYVQLGGKGWWGTHNDQPRQRKTGEIIFHPSMIPHQNVTFNDPMIATWRWSGDIDYAKYYME